MNIQGWYPLGLTDLISLDPVQETLKSLLQHQNLNASFLWHLAFIIQLSHMYMTTGKTIEDYTYLCQQSDVSAF